MRSKLLSLILFVSTAAWGQTISYDLDGIHDSLKKKATMIMQYENIELNIESLNKSVMKIHQVYSVVNAEGRSHLVFRDYNTSSSSLASAEIKVFDKTGKQVGRYKKKDLSTTAIADGFMNDLYVSYYNITPPSYPVTVEVEYERVLKSTMGIPDYRFISNKQSVVESHFTVKAPADLELRYKSRNMELKPAITDESSKKLYKWSVKNMPAMEYEDGSVEYNSFFPYVQIVTEQFSHYGYKGDMSSWTSFGNWLNQLYEGLDELPSQRQEFFRDLVKDAPSETEKIRRIYSYLQQNFRYVSIQLGIGGLKPFSASFTDEKKYGDCKALSNYMKAALKSVGIRSHVAVINAQYNMLPVDPDFPSNDFNHMILCVPGVKDSIWLECTSNTSEFGELGSFTENRNALLVTEKGGVLVPTPRSRAEANLYSSFTEVKMDADLSALTDTRINARGEFYEMMNYINKDKKDDQKVMIVRYLGYKQPDDFILAAEPEDKHSFSLKLALRKMHEFNAGSKYFINPRINKIWSDKLPAAENRMKDYYFKNPFQIRDTTVMFLPKGFTVDVLPQEKNFKCKYASYQFKSWHDQQQNAVFTATTLILDKHKVPARDYKEVKSFFDDVMKDDTQRLVIKGTPGEREKKAF